MILYFVIGLMVGIGAMSRMYNIDESLGHEIYIWDIILVAALIGLFWPAYLGVLTADMIDNS